MSSRGGEPKRLSEALSEVSHEFGLPDPASLGRLHDSWSALVGESVAQHAHLRGVREGVLQVAVDGGPWATQMRYMEPELVARINERLESEVVHKLHIFVSYPKA